MDVVAKGEKSIVFSQWDDMLSIMEHALEANRILFIRPRTIKKLGEDMKNFRTNNCYVLLMHVKHGAEGLTVVEANHIFMIEPLLNHSVDSQAINRIHRIGQTQKTFVHRYLISDTIEVKIDKMRMERQQHPDGDGDVRAINVNKQKGDAICSAGTFDGGFNQSELQELLR
jgi:E3 ubiquitin-protein ligase SHPRH